MIGLVVSGHINFATGMASAVHAITGDQDNLAFVDFVTSMSTDELENALNIAADAVDTGEGVLFLTDLPGGSPANRALSLVIKSQNKEVIAGVNLPMIANAVFERDDVSLKELVQMLIEIGTSSIQDMRQQFTLALNTADDECADGL
ncbi:PTS system, N-acetylgalactosamine-specific IIA component [Psychromonas sp. CNPT3]|uniref:PTS galactosamine/N-acetylgalactosamine transporter subunit IIA n=1 Tax=Psychromonas sp. CNPT3 TaxID=314282 RepID=UPI00006E441A|nr:PTS galactosamine/N-acetylgalactosamine transporter subunit IIA [Psychromonas sp. CNPT3]AGH82002.1 PTS system, N-acetylgalactosamine-specific IIA component [Psychromonas sp. CNPT3]